MTHFNLQECGQGPTHWEIICIDTDKFYTPIYVR